MRDDRVIDLFAGPGGWDEGVRHLGLRPVGVEWDAAACKTATAAGHVRFQHDIAALDPREFARTVFDGPVRGLIASPPCQGFSQAGKGKGRIDAALLLDAIPEMATGRDVRPDLRASMTDSRSILVLEPLRWAVALTPSWMAWEQVPAVLPIWEACAAVLRRLGYTVATGNLSSEQYGVPQTRKRAILVARAPWMTAAMGGARLPEPTHSRYYPRTPAKLDEGLLPWVSMAEALGWGMTRAPYPTIAGGTGGGPDPLLVGGSHARHKVKGEHEAGGDRWVQQSNYSAPPTAEKRTAAERGLGERELDVPSFAVTGRPPRWQAASGATGVQAPRADNAPSPTVTATANAVWLDDPADHRPSAGRPGERAASNLPAEDRDAAAFTPVNPRPNGALRDGDQPAATLIGGPPHWVYVNGTHEKAAVRDAEAPAPTVMFGARANTVEWAQVRPATTVQGDPRIAPPGHVGPPNGRARQMTGAVRVTVDEAAVLQSFPADYPWQGTKTAQYRQVGDAVPPRMALHIVAEVAAIAHPLLAGGEGPGEGPWPYRKPAPTVLGSMHGVLTRPGQTHHQAMREVTAQAKTDDEGDAA